MKSIYEVPRFSTRRTGRLVLRELGLEAGDPDLKAWNASADRVKNPTHECVIGVVGKYTHVRDAYKSIIESFVHAGAATTRASTCAGSRARDRAARPRRTIFESTAFWSPAVGERGIEGKIAAARFARERGIPYFGLCLGMQVATSSSRATSRVEGSAFERVRPPGAAEGHR